MILALIDLGCLSSQSEMPATDTIFQDPAGLLNSEQTSHGSWIVKGLTVFRAGHFKDSKGRPRTWTVEELDAMSQNFNYLRTLNIFPNVPVRADHSVSVHSVVGYFHNVYREGSLLKADVEFTEPTAYEKYNRKTFRARSLEVGAYESNDGQVFFPTVLGLAWVDISAVEGLYSREPSESPYNFSMTLTEDPVPDPQTPPATPPTPPPATPSAPPAPPAAVPPPPPSQFQAPPAAPPAPPAAPPAPAPMSFRINGQTVTDPTAAQAHIDAMEKFMKEQIEATRMSFVKALVTSKKILPTQEDETMNFAKMLTDEQYAVWTKQFTEQSNSSREAFVQSLVAANKIMAPAAQDTLSFAKMLTDEQYMAWTKQFEQAAPLAIFAPQGQQTGTTAPTMGVATEVAQLRETIAMHRRAGTPNVEKTSSYQRLKALDPTFV